MAKISFSSALKQPIRPLLGTSGLSGRGIRLRRELYGRRRGFRGRGAGFLSFLKDGAGADLVVGRALHGQSQRSHHEDDGAPSSGLRKDRSRAARTEGGLAAGAAESTGEVGGFTALEQHDDDQHEAVHHEKRGEQPTGPFEADDAPRFCVR